MLCHTPCEVQESHHLWNPLIQTGVLELVQRFACRHLPAAASSTARVSCSQDPSSSSWFFRSSSEAKHPVGEFGWTAQAYSPLSLWPFGSCFHGLTACCASGSSRPGLFNNQCFRQSIYDGTWPVYDSVQSSLCRCGGPAKSGDWTDFCFRSFLRHSCILEPYAGRSVLNKFFECGTPHVLPVFVEPGGFTIKGCSSAGSKSKTAGYLAEWQHLSKFLQLVLCTLQHGNTIQFRKGPPPFSGILPTTMHPGECLWVVLEKKKYFFTFGEKGVYLYTLPKSCAPCD